MGTNFTALCWSFFYFHQTISDYCEEDNTYTLLSCQHLSSQYPQNAANHCKTIKKVRSFFKKKCSVYLGAIFVPSNSVFAFQGRWPFLMDNFSQLLAFSMGAYLQSCQWQEMWEQIRRKWWGIKQLMGGWQRGETKCHRIRPTKSLWLKKSALKGFNVPCEVASLPEPWNPKSHFVRWWMNFQATKLPDKFVAMPLASCQTDTLWRGGGALF